MPLYAGVCETNITPPIGVWMAGYAYRPTGAVGVHDELHARAVVFNDGSSAVAIISMDLIGLDPDLVDQVRAGIAEKTGIPPEAIMLNASHTHGGPSVQTFNSMGPRDEPYVDVLVRKLVGLAKQASDTMKPAVLSYGRAPVQIGINRRQVNGGGGTVIGHNYAGPVAPHVDVVSICEPSGNRFAVMFSHACHGTTLGGDNLRFTADYIGYACDVVRRDSEGSPIPLFLQGCSGNLNPFRRGTYISSAHNGRLLGAAAHAALRSAAPLYDDVPMVYANKTVRLPLKPPPSVADCEAALAEWQGRLRVSRRNKDVGAAMHDAGMVNYWTQACAISKMDDPPLAEDFTIQYISVEGIRFIGLPAEPFVQYALDLDVQVDDPVFTLGYTNGVQGYLPTAGDYAYGGYEVDSAHRYYNKLMYTSDCERLVRDAMYELLGVAEPDRTPYAC